MICFSVEEIVIGMTTLPVVTLGDPVFHVAVVKRGLGIARRARVHTGMSNPHDGLRDDPSTNFSVSNPAEGSA